MATKTKTVITNKDGTQSSGYISNGKTYYDNGTRIGAGASVTDNSGKQWTMGADGTGTFTGYAEGSIKVSPTKPASGNYNTAYGYTGGTASPVNSTTNTAAATSADTYYTNYLAEQQAALAKAQESALAKAQEEAAAAAKARTTAAIDKNNAYIPQVNAASDKALQEAYIQSQLAKSNAPQTLAAMGYTGGATESSLLGLDSAYGNQRNALETSRNTSLDQIRQNAQQIQATGNADLADLSADYYSQLATAKANAASAAQSQANWQKEYDAQQQANAQANYANTATAYANDYQAQINKLKAQGFTDDDYEVKVLNQLRNEKIAAQNAALETAATSTENTMSAATALNYYRLGLLSKTDLANMGYGSYI